MLKPLNYVLKRIKNENIKKPIERALDTQFKFMANYMLQVVKSGFNAFYMPEGNFAVTGKKRASLMLHEVGHGINANKSRLAKGIQTGARYMPKFAVPLLLFNSVTHSAKYEQGESRSPMTKVKDFFEANAAKLAMLSFAPMIAEEALASARGLSAAKKVLGKENTGTFKKFYALGLASYVSAGVLSSFALKKASEERDKVVYDL